MAVPALHVLLSHPSAHKAKGGSLYDDGSDSDGPDGVDGPGGLHQVAEELVASIKAGDAAQVAECLRDAFELLEAEPHSEGPHEESDEE